MLEVGEKKDGVGKSNPLTDMGVLFVLRSGYSKSALDALLREMWSRMDVVRNPQVKKEVVRLSLQSERENFEARMEAFQRVGILSSEEVKKVSEEYAVLERVRKDEENRKRKDCGERDYGVGKRRKDGADSVYAVVQASPHVGVIDSGIWDRDVRSLSVTELNALTLCVRTSSSSSLSHK